MSAMSVIDLDTIIKELDVSFLGNLPRDGAEPPLARFGCCIIGSVHY
jgi:hypothetical protein